MMRLGIASLLQLKGHALSSIFFALLATTGRVPPQDVPILVVFGRPGSGKTTIAQSAVESVLQQQQSSLDGDSTIVRPIGLDLDVCVPQWMRDNFAKGLYPTLEERTAFAESACDYVEKCLQDEANTAAQQERQRLGAVVSFSFVNTDLRDVFRKRFPKASWFLVDTTEEEANERIRQREGHFYKGKIESSTKEEEKLRPRSDNDEWQFAPVTFPHTVLVGMKPISENADIVSRALLETAIRKQ